MLNAKEIDVVILCGGFGERLSSIIDDRPKPMTEFDDRPFLDILIDYVSSYGFCRFILCTGYMSDVIRHYYQRKIIDREILFSEESSPLGTAGAVRNAQGFIESDPFFVMNGDSFCKLDLVEFLRFHMGRDAIASIAVVDSRDTVEFGAVELDNTQQIIRFREKQRANNTSNYINAGIYIFNKEVLPLIPKDEFYSLEYDLFPGLKKCYGYIGDKELIDIGTPGGYEKAKQILRK